jgi:hypothetical protein
MPIAGRLAKAGPMSSKECREGQKRKSGPISKTRQRAVDHVAAKGRQVQFLVEEGQQQPKLARVRQFQPDFFVGFMPDVASTLSGYGLECGVYSVYRSDAILTCSIEDPLPVVSAEQPTREIWPGRPLLDNSDVSGSELQRLNCAENSN